MGNKLQLVTKIVYVFFYLDNYDYNGVPGTPSILKH